jgi:hypothetical protein
MAKAKKQVNDEYDVDSVAGNMPSEDMGGDDVNYQMGTIVVDMGSSEESDEEDLDPVNISEYEEIDESNAPTKASKAVSNDDEDADAGSMSDRIDPFLDNYNFDSDETWPE